VRRSSPRATIRRLSGTKSRPRLPAILVEQLPLCNLQHFAIIFVPLCTSACRRMQNGWQTAHLVPGCLDRMWLHHGLVVWESPCPILRHPVVPLGVGVGSRNEEHVLYSESHPRTIVAIVMEEHRRKRRSGVRRHACCPTRVQLRATKQPLPACGGGLLYCKWCVSVSASDQKSVEYCTGSGSRLWTGQSSNLPATHLRSSVGIEWHGFGFHGMGIVSCDRVRIAREEWDTRRMGEDENKARTRPRQKATTTLVTAESVNLAPTLMPSNIYPPPPETQISRAGG